MDHYGIPGVGGSLGKCAICGEDFLKEIIFGKTVQGFTCQGISQTMYCHKKCKKLVESCNGDWRKLPDGPLRQVFEENQDN